MCEIWGGLLGRCLGEGNSYPLPYSGLENSMDRTVHGVAESQTRLSNFQFHALLMGMGVQKTVQRIIRKNLQTELLWDPAITLPGMDPQALKSGFQSDHCIPMGLDSVPGHVTRSHTLQPRVCLRKLGDSMCLS